MPAWSPPGRGPARRAGSWRAERGSVTAETALALPVLVVVLAAALWAVAAVGAQLRCADAAAGAARAAARGEPADEVAALARRLAPAGASVTVRETGDEVHVRVMARVRAPVVVGLPALEVGGRAVALREPGVP